MPDSHLRILFIPLEFQSWSRARNLSYISYLGLDYGLRGNNLEVTTLPANVAHSPGESGTSHRSYWPDSLRTLCASKKFDQVWVEIVHSHLDADMLEFIAGVAPVRVALVGESLTYPPEAGAAHPHLAVRRSLVEDRLKTFTHAAVADEKDAADLNARGAVHAFWAPPSVPEGLIESPEIATPAGAAFLCDASERDLFPWASQSESSGLMPVLPISDTGLSGRFDSLQARLDAAAPHAVSWEGLQAYVDALQAIRREDFLLRMQGLAKGAAVAHLPSYLQSYGARVFEGMAVGRPVISWDIPDRPRNRALFRENEEIILFPQRNAGALRERLESLIRDPGSAARIARNARRKIWRFHTAEKRVRQILDWIGNGEKPILEDRDLAPSVGVAWDAFQKRFAEAAEPGRAQATSSLLEKVRRAESLASMGKMEAALEMLETAALEAPDDTRITRTLADMYAAAKQFQKASQAYFQAIQFDTQNITLWIECARACVESGNLEMAQAALEGALALEPANVQARELLRAVQEEQSPSPAPAYVKSDIDKYYEEFFLRSPEYSSPNPNPEEAARWDKIEIILRKLRDERTSLGKGPLRILDLGCGRGWIANLASRYGACEGMEPVAGVIEGARRLFPGITFYACEAADLRRLPGFRPYDIIINSEVIEHVPWPHKDAFVDAMKSLLAPGGSVILTTPRGEVFDEYMRIVNYQRQPIEDWTTEDQTRSLFEARGFRCGTPDRIWIRFPDCTYFPKATEAEERAGLMSIYQIWHFRQS